MMAPCQISLPLRETGMMAGICRNSLSILTVMSHYPATGSVQFHPPHQLHSLEQSAQFLLSPTVT